MYTIAVTGSGRSVALHPFRSLRFRNKTHPFSQNVNTALQRCLFHEKKKKKKKKVFAIGLIDY